MADPITFNSLEIERDFYGKEIHSLLRMIVLDAAEQAMNKHGWIFHVTSLLRTADEDRALGGSGVHVDGRGCDIRTKGVPARTVEAVAKYVNERWIYDPQRPQYLVCFIKPHGTGPHAHFQSHPRTRRRPAAASAA